MVLLLVLLLVLPLALPLVLLFVLLPITETFSLLGAQSRSSAVARRCG